jgi:hypothetical protein
MMPVVRDKVPEQIADEDAWGGESYGLVIVIEPADEAVLRTASQVLLTAAGIDVVWRGREQVRVEGDGWALGSNQEGGSRWAGLSLVELPCGQRVNCEVWAEYFGVDEWKWWEEASFYLYLDIPYKALGHLGERVWALELGEVDGSLAWRRPIDDWLAKVAIEVSRSVSFKRGIIGAEVARVFDVSPGPGAGFVFPDGTYLPATE